MPEVNSGLACLPVPSCLLRRAGAGAMLCIESGRLGCAQDLHRAAPPSVATTTGSDPCPCLVEQGEQAVARFRRMRRQPATRWHPRGSKLCRTAHAGRRFSVVITKRAHRNIRDDTMSIKWKFWSNSSAQHRWRHDTNCSRCAVIYASVRVVVG